MATSEPFGTGGPDPATRPRTHFTRAVIIVALIAGGAYWYGSGMYREYGLASMARKNESLRDMAREGEVRAAAVMFGVVVLLVGLSIPTLALGSLLAGYLFGFGVGIAIMSPSLTIGSVIAFVGSRYLFHEYFHRLADRSRRVRRWLDMINTGVARAPVAFLMTLRLSPSIPFGVVNFGMALSPIRLSTFTWVSWLGMLPVTATFVLIGTQASHIKRLRDMFDGEEGNYLLVLLIAVTVARLAIWWSRRLGERRKQPVETHSEPEREEARPTV
jgi:uncharacterized membrane protein YdjX (TVP38/TMEM64 family)